VDVYTAYHDPSRSFKETVDGPFAVRVCGGWFPRSILGKGHAFCAFFRCILVALHIAWRAFRFSPEPCLNRDRLLTQVAGARNCLCLASVGHSTHYSGVQTCWDSQGAVADSWV